ncbi:MAG: PIN domain-containing protein [Candidatus Korobacteraceae bacterium]|jgi:predicted nucleic acid-binding protein
MRIHVLDASALYRYLTNGAAEEIVARVLMDAAVAGNPVLMSVVNWGEVYYTLAKQIGLNKTENLMIGLADKLPVSVVGVAVEDAVRAARLKAQYNLPYADAFAAALTGTQRVLVTADVSHFERVPKLRLLKLPRAKKAGA